MGNRHDETYLRLFDAVAEHAEIMQASSDERHFLSTIKIDDFLYLVTAGTASCAPGAAVFNGRGLVDSVLARLRQLRRSEPAAPADDRARVRQATLATLADLAQFDEETLRISAETATRAILDAASVPEQLSVKITIEVSVIIGDLPAPG